MNKRCKVCKLGFSSIHSRGTNVAQGNYNKCDCTIKDLESTIELFEEIIAAPDFESKEQRLERIEYLKDVREKLEELK